MQAMDGSGGEGKVGLRLRWPWRSTAPEDAYPLPSACCRDQGVHGAAWHLKALERRTWHAHQAVGGLVGAQALRYRSRQHSTCTMHRADTHAHLRALQLQIWLVHGAARRLVHTPHGSRAPGVACA